MGFQQQVGLMAQGLQRGLDAAGRVVTSKSPSVDLAAALAPSVTVFLSDLETVRPAKTPVRGPLLSWCFDLETVRLAQNF